MTGSTGRSCACASTGHWGVAEIAAHLNLLLAAVKVLVSDLIDAGYLIHRQPRPAAAKPDIKLLQAVLDGVRKL